MYGSATRYYDLNNDGVYESLNVFRDSDSNASYDTYDRYDFAIGDQPEVADKATQRRAPMTCSIHLKMPIDTQSQVRSMLASQPR